MLICDKAYMDARLKKQIMCGVTKNICVHVRYCAVSMKYYQTDNAKDCVVRYEDGENNQTGQND